MVFSVIFSFADVITVGLCLYIPINYIHYYNRKSCSYQGFTQELVVERRNVLLALHDYLHSCDDKERKWWLYKRRSLGLAERLLLIAKLEQDKKLRKKFCDKSNKVYSCGEVLQFKKEPDGKHMKLYQAYFCKDRLCAMCQWRRQLKVTFQMRKTIEEALIEYPGSRFLFLTLTVKSVKGDDLRKTLQAMNKAFRNMIRWKKVNVDLLGFVRSAEVTVNKQTMMYHPHLHVLLMVRPSYFKGGHYFNHKQWQAMWKKAMKLDYDPMVNIQVIKPNSKRQDGQTILSAVAEVGKYQVKPTTYLTADKPQDALIIKTLEKQLKNSRMVTYGLVLKDINKKLFKDDNANSDDADLIKVNDDDNGIKATAEIVTAKWNTFVKNYVILSK